jgi:phosphate transport system substrate-binding protein
MNILLRLAVLAAVSGLVFGHPARAADDNTPAAPSAVPAPAPAAEPAPVAAPAPAPSAAEAAAPAPAPVEAPHVILTFRGSNTVGESLAPRLAQAFLIANGYTEVSIVRSKTDPDDATIVGTRNGKKEAIFVSAHGSGFAAKGLLAHAPETPTDIGMTSRRMAPAERQSLEAKGDMYGPTNEHILALDGVAVIVNSANPIGTLTVQQIKDLFSGTVADWGDKQVSGKAGPVHVYRRDDNSGTFDTFSSLVMHGAKIRPDAQQFEDSDALSAAVAKDPTGIGFIGLPYVGSNKALAVSNIGTAAIRPNRLTIATEDYALARRLFLYTTDTNSNPEIKRFIEFALSDAGQKLVEQVGFIPLSLRSEAAVASPGLSPEYVALTRRAERLTTDFRFRFGSSDLDNRALRDMSRLADYLAANKIPAKRLLLIGFGDNVGAAAATRLVSETRAKAVATVLRQRGIVVGQAVGLGSLQPIADNSTEEGRDRNRRVEVYVLPQ